MGAGCSEQAKPVRSPGDLNSPQELAMKYKKTRNIPGSKALRKGRSSLPEHVYFITKNTSSEPAADLTSDADPACVINSFFWAEAEKHWILMAFVIMPDHYHLLIKLGRKKSLSEVIGSIDNFISQKTRKPSKPCFVLWQTGFHDHHLRSKEPVEHYISYIHMNPVRRGLVEKPEDWEWSSANRRFQGRMRFIL